MRMGGGGSFHSHVRLHWKASCRSKCIYFSTTSTPVHLMPPQVSPSFVRFGTFQLPASRGGQELKLVKILADYVIHNHFPDVKGGEVGRQRAVRVT